MRGWEAEQAGETHPFAFTSDGAEPTVENQIPPATKPKPITKRTGMSKRKECWGAIFCKDKARSGENGAVRTGGEKTAERRDALCQKRNTNNKFARLRL